MPDSKGTERRWLIGVCDECDELWDGAENHRHRPGVHALEIDVEVVPAHQAEQAERKLDEEQQRTAILRNRLAAAEEELEEADQAFETAYQSLVERLTSEAAVVALAKRRHPFLATYEQAHQETVLLNARKDLQAALDSIQPEVDSNA